MTQVREGAGEDSQRPASGARVVGQQEGGGVITGRTGRLSPVARLWAELTEMGGKPLQILSRSTTDPT